MIEFEQADLINKEIISSIINEIDKRELVKIALSDLVDKYPALTRISLEDLYCRIATNIFDYGIFTDLDIRDLDYF